MYAIFYNFKSRLKEKSRSLLMYYNNLYCKISIKISLENLEKKYIIYFTHVYETNLNKKIWY